MVVTTALILALPQDSEPFRIKADSSDFASGAILSQQLPREEKWHPVALSQKVTYLFCDELRYRFKSLWVEFRQATKDVVKSEV